MIKGNVVDEWIRLRSVVEESIAWMKKQARENEKSGVILTASQAYADAADFLEKLSKK